MSDLDILAAQFPEQFNVVIARNTERSSGANHRITKRNTSGILRAAVNQTANKYRLTAIGRRDAISCPS